MPATDHDASAKHAILGTAQRLFAEEGFEKVSLRMLTQEAGVNLAAVNYHFGSKEGLIDAVVGAYVNEVNAGRLEALSNAEAKAGNKPLAVETILECFMQPALDAVRRSPLTEKLFFRLMGRCMNDDRGLRGMPEAAIKGFQDVLTEFPRALQAALPQLQRNEILLRLHFTVGVMIHALMNTDVLQCLTGEDDLGALTRDQLLAQMKVYGAHGFTGPPLPLTPTP